MTFNTTYQCDQCRAVILQGLTLETMFFVENWGSCDPALQDYRTARHFCDIHCLHKFTRKGLSKAAPLHIDRSFKWAVTNE